MAILSNRRHITPLDLYKNLKIGVALPLDETNLFKGTDTMREQLKANLINLLLTEPGERVNLPGFGVGLKTYLFENNINKDQLISLMNNKVRKYIRDIEVTNISINRGSNDHTMNIKILFTYTLDSTVDGIQLNFN